MKIPAFNQNQPAFKANIYVLLRNKFEELPLNRLKTRRQYVGYPWLLPKAVKFLREGFTDRSGGCNIGFISNDELGFIFHLIPFENSNEDVANFFKSSIKVLRQGNKHIKAFLTGGKTTVPESSYLHNAIKNVLKDLKMPFSSIWGIKQEGYTNLLSSAPKKQHFINAQQTYSGENITIHSMDDLAKIYEEIIIHPEDRVFFS